jgi:hypothetical protein
MSTEFIRLVELNQPHPSFNSDWDNYSVSEFAATFLPRIALLKNDFVALYDGAALFSTMQNTKSSRFPVTPVQLISFSYPKGVAAAQRQVHIRSGQDQVCLLFETSETGNVAVRFRFGVTFKKLLNDYFSRSAVLAIETGSYGTTREQLSERFPTRPDHDSLMRFLFETIGLDPAQVAADFQPYEPSPIRTELQLTEAPSEIPVNDFPDKFKSFIQNLTVNTVKNLDGEASFFRSKDQLNGKSGSTDTTYTGTFGFDRYDEPKSGKGKLALHYFPEVSAIAAGYRAPFVSLWVPKSKIPNTVPIDAAFVPVTKATIWMKVTQEAGKSSSKTQMPSLHIETGNAAVTINGQQTAVLYKDTSHTPFVIGDSWSFDVECTDILTEHVSVVFRETDAGGKVIGILNVAPNNRIYTANVNLIDVQFATTNSLSDGPKNHPLAKPLQDYCNTRCYNQGFIHVQVNPDATTFKVSKTTAGPLRSDYAGNDYLPTSDELSFHNRMLADYNKELVNSRGSNEEKNYQRLQAIIDSFDVTASKTNKAAKKELLDAIASLGKLLDKRFNRTYKKKTDRAEQTFNDPAVKAAITRYETARLSYRTLLLQKVTDEIANNSKNTDLVIYMEKVKESISNAILLSTTEASVKMNTGNTIYTFLYKMIESFKDDPANNGGVAGITLTGDGYVHMLNLALGNPATREELIAHEMGHAFSLGHPFEYNSTDIGKRFDKDYDSAKERRKKALEDLQSPVQKSTKNIYAYITRSIESILKVTFYTKYTDFEYIDGFLHPTRIAELIAVEKGTGTATARTTTEIEDAYKTDVAEIDARKNKALEDALDLPKAQSKENFMDYDVSKRNSFWYWQWQKMAEGQAPLKEHIL